MEFFNKKSKSGNSVSECNFMNTTINEMVYNAILTLAQQKVKEENRGYFQLWLLKNNKVKIDYAKAEKFLFDEQAKGYSIEDLEVKAYLSTNIAWFTWIAFKIENKLSGYSDRSDKVEWSLDKSQLTKPQLEEVMQLKQEPILANRKKILGNPQAALAVEFYSNNLGAMQVDRETYDYIVKVRTEKEQAEKQAKEKIKQALKQWALQNGSELVKLRIEEDMNWYELAEKEYYDSITPDEFEKLPNPDKSYPIKNATVEQILKLREVRRQYPDAELMHYKYSTDEEGCGLEEPHFKDVIQLTLKSITGNERIVEMELSQHKGDGDEE